MTRWEKFASAALQGLVESGRGENPPDRARWAAEHADSMEAEAAKREAWMSAKGAGWQYEVAMMELEAEPTICGCWLSAPRFRDAQRHMMELAHRAVVRRFKIEYYGGPAQKDTVSYSCCDDRQQDKVKWYRSLAEAVEGAPWRRHADEWRDGPIDPVSAVGRDPTGPVYAVGWLREYNTVGAWAPVPPDGSAFEFAEHLGDAGIIRRQNSYGPAEAQYTTDLGEHEHEASRAWFATILDAVDWRVADGEPADADLARVRRMKRGATEHDIAVMIEPGRHEATVSLPGLQFRVSYRQAERLRDVLKRAIPELSEQEPPAGEQCRYCSGTGYGPGGQPQPASQLERRSKQTGATWETISESHSCGGTSPRTTRTFRQPWGPSRRAGKCRPSSQSTAGAGRQRT